MDQLTTQPTPEQQRLDRLREFLPKCLPLAIWGLCGLEPSERRAALVTLARFMVEPKSEEPPHDT
jgi:hypothetical protein